MRILDQWQWCDGSLNCGDSWFDIPSETSTSYDIDSMINSENVAAEDGFRLKITYTDKQGYNNEISSSAIRRDAPASIRIRSKVFLEGPLQ